MIDQSSLKVFILLMERDQDRYAVPVSKIKHHSGNNELKLERNEHELDFREFVNLDSQKKLNLDSIFKSVCPNFPIFEFIFSDNFHTINVEAIVLIRNNQQFLSEFYSSFDKMLVDPIDVIQHPEKLIQSANFAVSLSGRIRHREQFRPDTRNSGNPHLCGGDFGRD